MDKLEDENKQKGKLFPTLNYEQEITTITMLLHVLSDCVQYIYLPIYISNKLLTLLLYDPTFNINTEGGNIHIN